MMKLKWINRKGFLDFFQISRMKVFMLLLIRFTNLMILDKIGGSCKSYCKNTPLFLIFIIKYEDSIMKIRKSSLIGKEYLAHSIPNKTFFFLVYIRGVCSKNIVPSNSTHKSAFKEESKLLNNWNSFLISQFILFQNLFICLLPRKTLWFWMLITAGK